MFYWRDKLNNNKKIMVYAEHGTFASILDAAFAENEIDWWSKDNLQCDICTESFAAYKLYDYLSQTGIPNISLQDDLKANYEADIALILTGKDTCGDILDSLDIDQTDFFPHSLISDEGYFIKEVPNNNKKLVFMVGNSRIAVLYAMYHFLKLQGFAFISPDKDGFIIPNISELACVGSTIIEQPDYTTRGFLSEYSDDNNKRFLEWIVANRLDNMSLCIEDIHYIKKMGLKIVLGGLGGGHKGMYEYLPPDQIDPNHIPALGEKTKTYFETHPEWFALRNGKREMGLVPGAFEKGYYTGNNFCMSNTEAVNEFCKNYLTSIIGGSLKHNDIVNIWPLDNGKWCECEECKKLGNYTRQILLLAYKLNQHIKDAKNKGLLKRDILLIVPAYHETLPEPDMPLPDDFDYTHIIVNLFTIERCYVHDLFDKNCTETNVTLADRIKEWTTKENRNYKGDLDIGEYFNVSSFASIPVVLTDRIAKDIPDYFKCGVKHFNFMHMISDNWGSKIVNNNLYASLLWNTKLDSQAYIDTMFESFYQDKALEIKEIYELLEKGMENCKYIFHYQFVDGKIKSLRSNITTEKPFDLKHIQYDKILHDENAGIDFLSGLKMVRTARDKIVKLCSKNKNLIIKDRLDQLRTHIEYGVDMYTFYYMILLYAKATREDNKQECARIAKIMKDLNENSTAYKWALAGYKLNITFFDSLASASWQKQLYEKIIEKEDLEGAKAELAL